MIYLTVKNSCRRPVLCMSNLWSRYSRCVRQPLTGSQCIVFGKYTIVKAIDEIDVCPTAFRSAAHASTSDSRPYHAPKSPCLILVTEPRVRVSKYTALLYCHSLHTVVVFSTFALGIVP